jgi:hypothetical protein
MNFIDAVIPAHPKDLKILEHCIAGVKKNVKNIRRIIVVSKEKLTNQAEWFAEDNYPFSFAEIAEIVNHQNVGWNYQQLLKLYAIKIIPNISENILIIDADTVFYKPCQFLSDDNIALYNLAKDIDLYQSQFQNSTLNHIKKIAPQIADKIPELFDSKAINNSSRSKNFIENLKFINQDDKIISSKFESGICHHMLIQKNIIDALFNIIESNFKKEKFYQIFLSNRDNSCAISEYNLYFYFLISHFPNQYKIRILNYKNTAKFNPKLESIRKKYHYCSYHSYMITDNFFEKYSKKFTTILKKNFYFEQWNIGFINNSIENILANNYQINWLKSPCAFEFIADPFGFQLNQKKYIIFEKYSLFSKSGFICLAELSENKLINQKILLKNNFHLSYPAILIEEEKIYITCESYKNNNLTLYLLDQQNLQLTKIRDIFSNKSIIDPTIFKHQDFYYLFYTTKQNPNCDLYIAYTKNLNQDFIDHPKNPVKSDITSSRPAGNIFIHNQKIFRPSQNCSESYGQALMINQITKLTPNDFEEQLIYQLKPDSTSLYNQGIHTLNSLDNLWLVDGKRKIFLFYKPLIAVFRFIKKYLSIRN